MNTHDPIVKGAGDQAVAICRECEPVERPLVYPGWMVLTFGSRRFCNAAARKHRSDSKHYRPDHAIKDQGAPEVPKQTGVNGAH